MKQKAGHGSVHGTKWLLRSFGLTVTIFGMENNVDTIFGKIIRGEIPVKVEYENDRVLAFHDISPQAPVHILIIPKKPLKDVAACQVGDQELLGELLLVAAEVARKLNLEQGGYRLVINTGIGAGQTVFHLHVHLLGGREFSWPPG